MNRGSFSLGIFKSFLIGLSTTLAFAGTATASASFQPLGIASGYTSSYANAVSSDGYVVVGQNEGSGTSEAFRWTQSGGLIGLSDLPGAGFASAASGVSSDGTVIVGRGWGASGTEAFRWTSTDGMQGLSDLSGGSFFSTATAISADGQFVVGHGNNSSSEQEATRWLSTSTMQPLGHLTGRAHFGSVLGSSTDGSVLVGYSGAEAFRWTSAGMVGLDDLGGGSFQSDARALSADGSVAVGYGTSAAGVEAYRWTAIAGMVSIGDLDGGTVESRAFGVSGDGSTIVGYGTSASGQEAFIWDAVHGMRTISDVLDANGIDLTGWTLTQANAISADGTTIVGYGTNPSGQVEAWVASVPEPASVSVIVLVGGMLLSRRNRPHA